MKDRNYGVKLSKGGASTFSLWAPRVNEVTLLIGETANALTRKVPMQRCESGFWLAEVEGLTDAMRYRYQLNGQSSYPDYASESQPDGVHEASAIVDHEFYRWQETGWQGIPLEEFILYEIHIGTFTNEGTFQAAAEKLRYLKKMGITAVSLMPVAQFPGSRNWGYDGTYLYAVQSTYGGHNGLKHFVDCCHQEGLAVILDVVYNHFGPEGNYFGAYAPYWTEKYSSPWGRANNFDDRHCDPVRAFFIENALYWFSQFRIDGLRLDAVHAISDQSARHFLGHLSDEVDAFSQRIGRKHYLIAESDLNDARLLHKKVIGGYHLDAQWCDDFHHSVHALLTGERKGYYSDFGSLVDLEKAMQQGYVYDGQFSHQRMRTHGNSPASLRHSQFIVYSQNHDQVGNRLFGERLPQLLSFDKLKVVAALVLLSPFQPMLFMGEEYGETRPFLYFIDHSDEALIAAVKEGRKKEFESFEFDGEAPDPFSSETFEKSKLDWTKLSIPEHDTLLQFYTTLIHLRKRHPGFSNSIAREVIVRSNTEKGLLAMQYNCRAETVIVIVNLSTVASEFMVNSDAPAAKLLLNSDDAQWLGNGKVLPPLLRDTGQSIRIAPFSVAVYSYHETRVG